LATEEYKVDLEVFEGPLDLLLYLIKRDEIDIYNIPIERITTQYMDYLGLMRMLDLNIAGEFLVMAATLMMIKSRMLLPEDERPEEEEEEDDPRWELVRQLVEYKKFKDVANVLQDHELQQENVFGPGGHSLKVEPDDTGLKLRDVSLFDLIAAFNDVLKNAPPDDIATIAAEHITVADKIDEILRRVKEEAPVTFRGLFDRMTSRAHIVCTFLALLELARLNQIRIEQDRTFDEIVIAEAEDEEEEQ